MVRITGEPAPRCTFCCTRLEGFSVSAGGKLLVEDVNLHLHCGELTALVGPNGAGKTTLLRAILGEIPHGGSITFLDAGGEETGMPVIGYVPQRFEFDLGSPASVLDYCAACLTQVPIWGYYPRRIRRRVEENLSRVKAEHLINRRIARLSGGELQRVLLACALDPMPNLLLLDEPVSGVDAGGLEMFYDMVSAIRNQYDLSIILVSHDLGNAAKYADRMILLNRRILAAGPPEEVLWGDAMDRTFGTSALLPAGLQRGPKINVHHDRGKKID